MKNSLLLIATLLGFIACKQPNSASSFDKQKVESEATTMLKEYFSSINTKGLLAEFDYLDTSKDFFWVPPGYFMKLTYTETSDAIKANSKAIKSLNNSWKKLEVHALSNEIASYTGIVSSQFTDTSGKTTAMELIETGVVVRRVNGWKLISGQTAVLPSSN